MKTHTATPQSELPATGGSVSNPTPSGGTTCKRRFNALLMSVATLSMLAVVNTLQAAIPAPVWHDSDLKTASGSGTTLTVDRPGNLSAGDLVILLFTQQLSPSGNTSSFSAPAGFTAIRSEHDASNQDRPEVAAFYKIATSSEPATYTSTVSQEGRTPRWKAVAARVTGHDALKPIGSHNGANSGGTNVSSIAISGIASASPESLLIAARSVRRAVTLESDPAGMSMEWSMAGSGNSDNRDNPPAFRGASQVIPNEGTTGSRHFAWSGDALASGLMFSINRHKPRADLEVTKTASHPAPAAGDSVTFFVTVTNHGPDAATGVKVFDKLTDGFTYQGDNSGGAYDPVEGIWNIGNLAVNASVTMEITAVVNATGDFSNDATVVGNEEDPNPSNSVVRSGIYEADLSLTKSVSPLNAKEGDTVVFTLAVTNTGPQDAVNVRVEDQLPSGYAYQGDDGAGSYNPVTGIWTIGALANQAQATLRIEATVQANGRYLNLASVQSGSFDPNPANNHAKASIDNPNMPIVNGLIHGDGDHERYVLLTTSENGTKLYGYFDITTGRYYTALVVNRSVNDNVFGNREYTSSAGWGPPREFKRLTDSEFMEFTLTCGPQSWTWRQAYCAQPGGTNDLSSPTWVSNHQVAAGSGTPPPGYVSASSLAWNLNNHARGNPNSWDVSQGGSLAFNDWKSPFNPAAPNNVIGMEGYPATREITFCETHGWEWAMIYEFSVDLSECGPYPVRLKNIRSHHSPAKTGEEDEPIEISSELLDWGDLPAPYPTLKADNGARHEVVMGGAYLGIMPPDMEEDGQPHPAALGDDLNGLSDEDGVRFLTPVIAGSTARIQVTAGTAGFLSAWMDFNGDGTLTQLVPLSVAGPAMVAAGAIGDLHLPQPGDYVFTIPVPSDAAGRMASRWRFTNEAGQGGNSITGLALTGEVEDYMLGTIGDRVWMDANGNGLQDEGEPGVAGVTVRLLDAHGSAVLDGNGNALIATTDSDGEYLFTGLPAGSYQVEFVRPDGHFLTRENADGSGLNGPLNSDANPVTGRSVVFELTSGEINTHIDAGLYLPGSISGGVYFDSTGDDFGDTPMQGVVLSLVDADSNPVRDAHDVPMTTSTGEDGKYSFTNLLPGFYQVVQTQPVGYISVSDVDGGDLDINGDVSIIALGLGQHITGQDFVETKLTTISGHVFVKTTPLAGVTITLIDRYGNPVDGDPETPGIQPITTVTGANGYYVFHNVPAGTYMVGQTRPEGYLSFGDADGGDPDIIGDVTPIGTLPGEHSKDNNFILMLDGCPDTWDEWKLQHPGETPAGNPDEDAYDNLAEFAFAMPYDQGTGSEWLGHTAWIIRPSEIAPGTLEGVFIRPKGAYLNVTYTLEYAAALGNPTEWQELVIDTGLAANATTEDNGDCTETVTIHDLESLTGMTGGEGFVRIRVDLDDDGGNNGDIDHTSFTEVQGWTATDLDPHCQSYNNPYLTESVFTGTVSGVNGFDAVLGIGSGPLDFDTLLDPAQSYFIEVQSGDLEGHRFDIMAGEGNALTLGDGPGTTLFLGSGEEPVDATSSIVIGGLPVELVGGRIAIHRHRTLDNLFPPSGFGAAASRRAADKVRIFAGGLWTDYWLFSNNGEPVWLKAGANSLDDYGSTVIPPGQGVFFDSPQTTTSILAYGEVRQNSFVRPLEVGHSLVGGGFPMDQSANGLNGRNMNAGTGFFGTNDFKTADSFYYWNGDFTSGAVGYTSYFLLDRSPINSMSVRWVKTGDVWAEPRDEEILLLGDRAVFIRSKHGNELHTMPVPWSP